MKNKLQNFTLITLILLFLYLFFQYSFIFKTCIINGSILFFNNVFPTLLPMFIINDLLLNYHFGNYLNFFFGPFFSKIFKMNNHALYIFIMSCFSGTPTNAYITANLTQNNNLPIKEAGIILAYSFFINPLFLFTMLNNIFNDFKTSLQIILICYLTNLIICFFYRFFPYSSNNQLLPTKSLSFSEILNKSISKSMLTLLTILGTIIFYLILSEGLNIFIHNDLLNCLFNGVLEITGGLAKLASLNINLQFKKILATIFISFGGFSIHSQIKGIILEEKIPFKYFFITRFIQVFLATSICIICS